jgi:ferredoxin
MRRHRPSGVAHATLNIGNAFRGLKPTATFRRSLRDLGVCMELKRKFPLTINRTAHSKWPMPKFTDRWQENVPGKFYVDWQCTDCDLCRETAPEIFKRNEEGGYSYVHRQPITDEEIEKTIEALEGCCVDCIGADGDTGDWSIPPETIVAPPSGEKRTCGCKSGQCASTEKAAVKPWWKFWA